MSKEPWSKEDQMARDMAAIHELATQMADQSFEQQPEPKPRPSLVESAMPAPKTPLQKNPRSPSLATIAPKTPPKRPGTPPKRLSTPQLMPTAKWIQQPMAPQQATVHPVQRWGTTTKANL